MLYKKFRFLTRFALALFTKHFPAIIFGLILSLISFYSFPKIVSLLPQSRVVYHIGIVGRFTSDTLPPEISEKVSLGLTSLDTASRPQPGLASSWETDPTGKIYTFHINTGLTWHDGRPVIAEDIQYNFRDAQVETPKTDRLVIRLPDLFSPLPAYVARPVFKKNSGTRFIGVGSYSVAHIKRNGLYLDSVTLKPRDFSSRLPILKYHIFTSPGLARTAYKLGLVDTILNIEDLADLIDWSPKTEITASTLTNQQIVLFFDTQNPILAGNSGKNLRLALAYAADKSKFSSRSPSPLSSHSWAFNPNVKKYDFDLTRAKQLLKNVEKIPETLTISTLPEYLDTAQQLKSDWERLGISIDITASHDLPRDFQLLLIPQVVPPDPDQYHLWHSTQGQTNLTRLKNPRIDKLLEDGRKTIDPEARKKIYFEFQKYLVEEVPAIFLYHPVIYTITRK